MYTADSIQQFIAEYGYKPSSCKKEIKDLPELLHPNEQLCALLEAQFKDVHNKESSGYGLAIATNQRILCYRKSFLGTVTSEEIPLLKITGVSYRKGLVFGSVIVTSGNNDSIYENCMKPDAEKFAKVVQQLLSNTSTQEVAANTPQQAKVNNLDQLERLFELKQKGILTEEEFAAEKVKLLS